jgi:HEAT repeat protein
LSPQNSVIMSLKTNPATVVSVGGQTYDAKDLDKIHDILHQMANTVSAMKIFPSEHASIAKFVDDLTWKFKSFLDTHGRFEIWISEFSFVCGDTVVYADDIPVKSLPFFFFKDGMQKLYFYEGLDKDEIVDFLEIIKQEARKPAQDSDIVSALWERDFAHIQYYSPDDFLENRILEECGQAEAKPGAPDVAEFSHKAIEIKVDTSKFTGGKIELSDEDREVIRERSAIKELAQEEEPRIALERAASAEPVRLEPIPEEAAPETPSTPPLPEGEEKAEEAAPEPPAPEREEVPEGPAAVDLTMSDPEVRNLEALISSSRKISPDEEFLNLMIEILNLEKGMDHLKTDLDILLEYEIEQIQQGNFRFAALLVQKLRELRDHVAAQSPDKSALFDGFLKGTSSGKTLDAVKSLFKSGAEVDWDSLVEFIRLLGTPALPLAADIFETVPHPESREKILDFIKSINADDPGRLASLAGDERPLLSKAIIGFLGRDFGQKGLSHFAVFLRFKTKELKLEAIHALGQARGELSDKILMGFLNDPDEEIRIEAVSRLDPAEGKPRVLHLIREASARGFRTKSLKEKQAFFSFLGRTRSEEALEFLRKTLEKKHLWLSGRTRQVKLAAVAGLESMRTSAAVGVLENGSRARTRTVRQACSLALNRLKADHPSVRSEDKT